MQKEFEPKLFPCPAAAGIEHFARGDNSKVYMCGDAVVKIYNRDIDQTIANLYVVVTNEASALLDRESLKASLPFSKTEFRLRINPFMAVHKCDNCERMEALMPFIPGKNLEERIREFDEKEIEIFLRNIDFLLEEKMSVSGLELLPLNIKLIGDKTLVITDLCADIRKLRRSIY